jgi:hypothetical protein
MMMMTMTMMMIIIIIIIIIVIIIIIIMSSSSALAWESAKYIYFPHDRNVFSTVRIYFAFLIIWRTSVKCQVALGAFAKLLKAPADFVTSSCFLCARLFTCISATRMGQISLKFDIGTLTMICRESEFV